MNAMKSPKLRVISFVYWFLLLYMVAALAWWFIALEKQNTLISSIELNELVSSDPAYLSKVRAIETATNRKTTQYIGEGITFLALILLGATYIYRAIRRQLRLSEQQQNFMMAITHELKTPIAVTQLNLETLQKRKLDEEKQQKLITNTLQEANRLNSLCNNILFAAQLDAGRYASAIQSVQLTDLLKTCVAECSARYPSRIFNRQTAGEIQIDGDPFLLQLLLSNLLENAVKYSPRDKSITVALSSGNKQVKLEVIDEGQGVQDSEKKKVFDKFYRVGNENTRRAQGTGLGLYLCRKICESHNANIFVTDNHPNGSNFTVLFKSKHGRS